MEKKWALVTGASSGIGLAYAEELASRGYQLVIVSNEEQAIREKGEFLSEKYGIEVLPLYRDLAIPGAAKELYDTCQEKNIPIEVLVNNAGMFFFCETLQAKANIVEKMLYLHVTTPTQLCYYFGQEDEETASWIYPQYVIPILLATLSGNYAVRFHQAILEKLLPRLAFGVTGLWSKRNRTLSRCRRHEFI